MKKVATSVLLLAGLTVASTALAVDLHSTKGTIANQPSLVFKTTATFACDDGNATNGYITYDTDLFGNSFNFPPNSRLTSVTFAHYGFGTPGPYNYDLELWDQASCTVITAVNNLVAADAGGSPQVELVSLCLQSIVVSGNVLVMIDSNTCPAGPLDCYPVLLFDDQSGQACPWYIDMTAGFPCFNINNVFGPSFAHPFLLRVSTDQCPVPVKSGSWGAVKQIYR